MHIFVSRSLAEDSPIKKIASKLELTDMSLIDFTPMEFVPPAADWVFFYSRNGVKHFFLQGSHELVPYKWGCMSLGTADELSKYVLDVEFVGSGTPDEVAEQFKVARSFEESVCYIRANHSIDSVRTIIDHPTDWSIPVYDNLPIEEIPSATFDLLVFTSPLNASIWLEHNTYDGQPIIAIGITTAKAIKEINREAEIVIASHPSEEAIAKKIEELINKA